MLNHRLTYKYQSPEMGESNTPTANSAQRSIKNKVSTKIIRNFPFLDVVFRTRYSTPKPKVERSINAKVKSVKVHLNLALLSSCSSKGMHNRSIIMIRITC